MVMIQCGQLPIFAYSRVFRKSQRNKTKIFLRKHNSLIKRWQIIKKRELN